LLLRPHSAAQWLRALAWKGGEKPEADMDPIEQVKVLAEALRQIGAIAVEPEDDDPMAALLEAQQIANDALLLAGLKS
jgi:hypothetical protein